MTEENFVEIQLFDVDVRDRIRKTEDAVQREEGQQRRYKPNKSTVHILGKTKEGHSVYVKVKKFRPWLLPHRFASLS